MRFQKNRLGLAIVVSLLLHLLLIGLFFIGSFWDSALPVAGGSGGDSDVLDAVMVDTAQVATEYGKLNKNLVEDDSETASHKEKTDTVPMAEKAEKNEVIRQQNEEQRLAQLERQRLDDLEKQKAKEETTRKKEAELARLKAEAEAKRLEATAKKSEEERKAKEMELQKLQMEEEQKKAEKEAKEKKEKAEKEAKEKKEKAEKEAKEKKEKAEKEAKEKKEKAEKEAKEKKEKAEKEAKEKKEKAEKEAKEKLQANKALDDFLNSGDIGTASKGGNQSKLGSEGSGGVKGSGDGSVDGRQYEARIKRLIESKYRKDESFRGKVCLIQIFFERDGTIRKHEIISGPEDICRAGASAIIATKKVPPAPSEEVYNQYRQPIMRFELQVK